MKIFIKKFKTNRKRKQNNQVDLEMAHQIVIGLILLFMY